jgi:peptide/nickel transport system permease protein
MTESHGPIDLSGLSVHGGRHERGGASLTMVLPGLPQLLAGRWGIGGTVWLTWVGLLWLTVARFDRVMWALWGAPGGALGDSTGPSLDDRVALATLLCGLIGSWWWSRADIRRGPRAKGEGVSQWVLAGRMFRKNRLAVVGLMAIFGLYMVALLTPFIAPYDPIDFGALGGRFSAPSGDHWLGTDQLNRDVFSRVLFGARVSLSIGFVAVGISITLGTLVGAVAGFLGGKVDAVIMRFVDMIISFPRLVLLITIVALFQHSSIFLIIAVLGFTQWPGTSRIVRGEVLSLREREFVQAARALGFSNLRIILRHIIPNTLAPVIVAATLGIGNVIVLEAGLSFLGLGLQPPTASWGSMVADGRADMLDAWWLSMFPGLAIVVTVVCFNLVGDGLRDALDPRSRA